MIYSNIFSFLHLNWRGRTSKLFFVNLMYQNIIQQNKLLIEI